MAAVSSFPPGPTARFVQPIVFTSNRDDSAGGDTNNDGVGTGSNADWGDIQLTSSSTGNVLDHVELRFAGGNSVAGALIVNGAPLALTNSLIRNASANALRLLSSNPTLTGDTFQNNQ